MTEYLDGLHETLRQGDVILAPTAVLLSAAEADADEGVPDPPARLGVYTRTLPWSATASAMVPGTVLETLWTPVLVISHDCQLEKDFNERIVELLAGGTELDDAREEASSDPSLDPFAVVAPLQPYGAFPAQRHSGLRSGDRIGCFPLNGLPGDGGDYVVDLGRLSTVSVRLLPQSAKVASLAPASVAELRYKLAEAYSIRDLSVLAELEAMVGHTIFRAEALQKSKKKSALVLHLDNGDIVHLEIRRPREELSAEVTRLPAAG
jgi:hypothetical protein